MKLFIDTGIVKEIEALASLGIIDGATTNPSLMAKAGGDRRDPEEICQLVKGPVSGEVVATDYDGMIREGRDLAAIDEHMVVKVPFTQDGVKACKTLSSEGMRVNVTLIFSATQALLAAKVGATFVSPFVGRLDDIATDGMHLIEEWSRSSTTTTSAPRCWSPACGTRCTSSRPRGWAPTSAPARRRSSSRCSSTRSPTSAWRSS